MVVVSKGILNSEGSNNCFLSCVVQILWANEEFRTGILKNPPHRMTLVSPPAVRHYFQDWVFSFFFFSFLKKVSDVTWWENLKIDF